MTTIPFVLVTGFLGSGKTTLLKRMLAAYAGHKRLLIVQNEFSDAGVDGTELRATGAPFELMEVNRGSVFCVCLLGDFTTSLAAAIAKAKPDVVILEATGLADPIAVAQLVTCGPLAGLLHLGSAWCVVDNVNIAKLSSLTQVARQIRIADMVIVNKTDLAPDTASTTAKIRELNPHAEIRFADHCDTSLPGFDALACELPVAEVRRDENAAFESCRRPDVGSAVVRRAEPCDHADIVAFVNTVGPTLWRLKGYCRTREGGLMIQSVFGTTRIDHLAGYRGPTEIVALGPNIDQTSFAASFATALRS